MIINTDSVTKGAESLDLALKEYQKALNKLSAASIFCSYNVPYQEVINNVSNLEKMCSGLVDDCNNFNDEVTNDDTLIEAILSPEENSDDLTVDYTGYDMIATSNGSLLGEKGNSKTAIMSVKDGYLIKVLDDSDPEYDLVMCFRKAGDTGHVGYVRKGCLSETGYQSNLDFFVQESGGYARVGKSGVRVRETPNGDILTTVPEGTYVKVLAFTPVPDYTNELSWVVVSYRNKDGQVQTGFMREDMMHWYDSEESMREAYQKENDRAKITGDKVRFRTSPDTLSDNVICKLKKNVEVLILDETDEWYHVRYNGEEGYVSKQYSQRQLQSTIPNELRNYKFEGN